MPTGRSLVSPRLSGRSVSPSAKGWRHSGRPGGGVLIVGGAFDGNVLTSGDMQSNGDNILLSGDEQSGTDQLKLSGNE